MPDEPTTPDEVEIDGSHPAAEDAAPPPPPPPPIDGLPVDDFEDEGAVAHPDQSTDALPGSVS